MKALKIIGSAFLLLLILLVGGFVVLGLLLPDEATVTNTTKINASPETVWKVINSPDKYTEWAPNMKKVEVIDDKNWKEFIEGNDQPIVFEIVDSEEPKSLSIKYDMEGFMAGEWNGKLNKTAEGADLITEDKIIHKNWFGKILMPLFFDLDDFAKSWNAALKKQAEKLHLQTEKIK